MEERTETTENKWCPGRDLNPHDPFGSTDFKPVDMTLISHRNAMESCVSPQNDIESQWRNAPQVAQNKHSAVTIRLTKGKVALVDAEDEACVLGFGKWSAHWNGYGWYAVNKRGGSATYLHRLIVAATSGEQVDHLSGDGLDCRKANLRKATPSQNGANRMVRKDSTTGLKGVRKIGSRWAARIKQNGAFRVIGRFDTAEEAAKAYDSAAIAAFGEYARPNYSSTVSR